jgi:hypothetical protein
MRRVKYLQISLHEYKQQTKQKKEFQNTVKKWQQYFEKIKEK